MKIKNGINAIYLMQIIDALAFSISGIFIPILMLDYGYDFRAIIYYFIIHNLVLLAGCFAAGYLAEGLGFKKILLFRYPFLFFYLIFLIYLKELDINIFVLAVASGLQSAFYYTPLNVLFARHTNANEMGGSLGKLMALPQIAGLAGPFLGGVIVYFFGFKPLFAATFIISFCSMLPLLLSPSLKDNYHFRPKKGLAFFKKHPKLILSEIFDNIGGETDGIIWPIFVYFTVKNVVSIGALGTLVAIGSALFTLYIGKQVNKKNEKFFIRIAVPLLMVNWFVRYAFSNEILIYISTLLSGVFTVLLILPYTHLTFNKAKQDINEDFFIIKEIPTVIGRLLIFVLALLFIDNIQSLFPLVGLSYLYFLFLYSVSAKICCWLFFFFLVFLFFL